MNFCLFFSLLFSARDLKVKTIWRWNEKELLKRTLSWRSLINARRCDAIANTKSQFLLKLVYLCRILWWCKAWKWDSSCWSFFFELTPRHEAKKAPQQSASERTRHKKDTQTIIPRATCFLRDFFLCSGSLSQYRLQRKSQSSDLVKRFYGQDKAKKCFFLMHHVVTLKISKTNENSTQAAHENGYVVTEVKF